MKVLQKQFETTLNKVILSDVKFVKCQHAKETANKVQSPGKRRASFSLTNSPAVSEEDDCKGNQDNPKIKSPKTYDCNEDIL